MGTSTALGGGRQPRSEREMGAGVSWLPLAPSMGFCTLSTGLWTVTKGSWHMLGEGQGSQIDVVLLTL